MSSAEFGPNRANWLLQPSLSAGRLRSNSAEPHLPPIFTMYTNAVYYPNWQVYKNNPPSSLNLEVISHVFYAFAWSVDWAALDPDQGVGDID